MEKLKVTNDYIFKKILREYNGKILTEDLEMHFIQIPKCSKEDKKTKLDQWMQFIGDISKEGVKRAMEENKEIKKAQEELEYLTGDEEERRIAFLREKAIRDEVSNINGARKEGEKNKQLEIAKKLKKMNMSLSDIEKATGLTVEEIESL